MTTNTLYWFHFDISYDFFDIVLVINLCEMHVHLIINIMLSFVDTMINCKYIYVYC